mgnify:CR=1 FL=1
MLTYNYLLTYTQDGQERYKWFATEEEMDHYIDNNREISVNEGVHIKEYEIVRGFKRRVVN